MKLLLSLNIFAFTFYIITAKVAYRDPDYFIPLILKTREFHSSSGVILAYPAHSYEDLYVAHLLHSWSRALGRERIVTVDVKFTSIYKVKKYFLNTTRPLIVVVIPHTKRFADFSNTTKTLNMSFVKWLVIFMRTPSNDEHIYCHKPVGNPFNLAFNVEMWVLCPDDNIIREWYSLDSNTTEIFELATYDPPRGIVLHTNLSLYDRRNDMKGMILRVIKMTGSVGANKSNRIFHAFFVAAFNELVKRLNITPEIVEEMSTYGSFNSTSHTWSGAIAELAAGRADIGVGGFTMASDRLDVVDFLIPLLVSKESFFIKKPDTFHMQWSAYFEAFSPAIWLSISMIIIIVPVILILIKRYSGTVKKADSISEEFLQILGIFCQQSLTEPSEYSWLRVVHFTLFATAVVIYAAYSASLIRFLTTRIPLLPFLSIDEFIENGSYDLIAVCNGAEYDLLATSKNPVFVALMKLMRPYDALPKSSLEAYQTLCQESNVALYLTDISIKLLRSIIPCDLSVISIGRSVSLSFIASKGSPYTACFNHHLLKFLSNGMFSRMKNVYYPETSSEDMVFQAVEMFNVITVFAIVVGGILLSIVVLIFETLYFNYTYRKKSNNSRNTLEWTDFEYLD